MRLINADVIIEEAHRQGKSMVTVELLENMPTADVVPSRYGCGSAPYCSDVWEVDEDE